MGLAHVWWYEPLFPAFGEFEAKGLSVWVQANLGYIVQLCLLNYKRFFKTWIKKFANILNVLWII